jgi:hypothetical protein
MQRYTPKNSRELNELVDILIKVDGLLETLPVEAENNTGIRARTA